MRHQLTVGWYYMLWEESMYSGTSEAGYNEYESANRDGRVSFKCAISS